MEQGALRLDKLKVCCCKELLCAPLKQRTVMKPPLAKLKESCLGIEPNCQKTLLYVLYFKDVSIPLSRKQSDLNRIV